MGHDARIVKRCVDSAELSNSAVHHRRDLRVVADVAPYCDHLVACGTQLLGFRFYNLLPEVGQCDGRTCLGEGLRSGEAHTRGCSRDECHLAGKVQ